MSLMGVDLGGSGAKATVFDARGTVLARAKSEYSPISPRAGWLEFEPNVQWDCLCEAIGRVAHTDALRRDPIRAVGISVAGEAVLPADRHGHPLYNSIATPDLRGSEQVEWWDQRLGAKRIYETTGQPLDGIYSLVRALWFRQSMPELFARTWKFLLWQEHLLMRMGLPPALDLGNASRTMAFDIRAGNWSDEILSAAQVSPELFAPTAPSGTVIGVIAPQLAAELGLERGALAGEERREAQATGGSVYDLIAQRMPTEPTRLLVLPHFAGAFSPVRDAHSKGAVLGLRIETSREELARSLLEGTAYELRRIIEYLESQGVRIDTLRNTGGGANSPVWLQIKADILNRPVVPVQVKDSACLGAAILAAAATGEHSDLASAVQAMVRLERSYEPDPRRAAIYAERYALYRELYKATAPFHHVL